MGLIANPARIRSDSAYMVELLTRKYPNEWIGSRIHYELLLLVRRRLFKCLPSEQQMLIIEALCDKGVDADTVMFIAVKAKVPKSLRRKWGRLRSRPTTWGIRTFIEFWRKEVN